MNLCTIACPSCGGHVQFPDTDAGHLADCPHCHLTLTLTIPGQPPADAAAPQLAHRLEGDWAGLGWTLAIIGLILLFYAWPLALILFVAGVTLACQKKCSQCGTRLSHGAPQCPGCHRPIEFES